MKNIRGIFSIAALSLIATSASAGPCDWRPSQLVGAGGTAAIGTASAGASGVGLAIKAAGFYTLSHGVTAATMLGSTLGGASAAGTVGIMGGSAGLIGGTVAFLTGPFVVVGGAVLAAGVGAFEGACFFTDERITDKMEVAALMRTIASSANPEIFQLMDADSDISEPHIRIRTGEEEYEKYELSKLYVVNGVLKYRRFGLNATIGNIYLIK